MIIFISIGSKWGLSFQFTLYNNKKKDKYRQNKKVTFH